MTDVILEVRDIVKTFPGVRALDGVSLECRRGEVHALVGENGAGKSTLMKLIAGVYQPDSGEIVFRGTPVTLHSPRDAQQLGIATIYQELNLLPNLTVAENILLGQEPLGRFGLIDREGERRRALGVLAQLGADLDPDTPTLQLGVAQQQLVEIAKALAYNAELIIMDEPSAVLAGEELERLFEIIAGLKQRGVTILYVSHRLDEIFRIADRVTVLKDGQLTGVLAVSETNKAELIRLMVGRPLSETFPQRAGSVGEPLLRIEGLSSGSLLRDVSLTLHRGEILGLAGLVGAGRTALARAIFGAEPVEAGTLTLDGKPYRVRSPAQAIEQGLGFVTEDRKAEGLVLIQSVRRNIALPSLRRRQRMGVVEERSERRTARAMADELDIRTPHIDHTVELLSGGNQQKVVLAKWLVTQPEVLIFDEPTRGIDVGSKAEVYSLMRALADQGKAILMISSELPEILGMSDRIVVMHDGQIAGELLPGEATEEKVMVLATGGDGHQHAMTARAAAEPSEAAGRPASKALAWLRHALGNSNTTVTTIYGLLLVLVLFAAVVSPYFRSLSNVQNILRQSVGLGLVSIGQTLVILAGGIDISVSSVITLTAVLSAGIMNGRVEMIAPAVLACLAMGLAVGVTNGLLVTKLGLPHFIATFGTWSIVRGIVLLYTRGPVGLIPRPFRFVADGQLGPLPFPVLVWAAALAVSMLVLRRARFGRYARAVGGNPEIARLSGIRVHRVQMTTYIVSSLLAVVAGLFLSARMGVGDPNVGSGFEWDSITAAVVGGANWLGWGSLAGTLAGVLMVITLNNVMNQLNINFWYQQVLKGLILLSAVILYRQRQRK